MSNYTTHFLSPAYPYDQAQVGQYRWGAPHLVEQVPISQLYPRQAPPPYHHQMQYAAQYTHYHNNSAVNMPTSNSIEQTTSGNKSNTIRPSSASTASILLKDTEVEPIAIAALGPPPTATRKPPVTVTAQLDTPKEARAGTRTASNLEKHALAALNCIFSGKSFEKVRPVWLRNPRTGRLCELDFYNDELKLGVEIQGLQHYVYPNNWHKNRSEWEDQIYRDRLKEELCRRANVTLVHVPFTVAANRVEQYIREEIPRVALSSSALHAWLQTAYPQLR